MKMALEKIAFLPFGNAGILAALVFGIWFFLAVEGVTGEENAIAAAVAEELKKVGVPADAYADATFLAAPVGSMSATIAPVCSLATASATGSFGAGGS